MTDQKQDYSDVLAALEFRSEGWAMEAYKAIESLQAEVERLDTDAGLYHDCRKMYLELQAAVDAVPTTVVTDFGVIFESAYRMLEDWHEQHGRLRTTSTPPQTAETD